MAHLEGLMKDLNAITTAWPPSPGHDSRQFHKSWDSALEHKELYRGKRKDKKKKKRRKKNRKRDSTWEHTQKANEPTSAFVLQLVKKRWPCRHSAMKSLPSWIPCTCWDRAGWDASGWNLASRQKEKKWTSWLFFFWSGFVSVVWLPCLFSVGHSHLCTILFVFLFYLFL